MANSFRFRLHSILRLRERERDQAADEFKLAMQAKQVLLDQISTFQTERQQVNLQRNIAQTGVFDPQKMLTAQRYQIHLDSQIAHLQEQVSLVEQECQRRRARLVKCEQAVRALEKLKEKQQADWDAVLITKSQDRLDQWSSFRYWSEQAISNIQTPETEQAEAESRKQSDSEISSDKAIP